MPRWPRYDVEATELFTSKIKVMQNSNYYADFARRFAGKQTNDFVETFNRQSSHRGWCGMRAYHDLALLDEFCRRDIDVSAVYDGRTISFAHPVKYDEGGRRLVALCDGSHPSRV